MIFMKKYGKILNIALPIITTACILAIWAVAAAVANEEILLPRPSAAFKRFFMLFGEARFYAAYLSTLLRSLAAFAVSFLLAVGCALLAEKFAAAEKVMNTLIPLIRALPTIAVVLLLVLWTASGVAAVLVTVLVVFPTLYTNARAAFGKVDDGLKEMCRVYAVPKKTRLFKVYLPVAAPLLVSAAGAGLSLNVKLMVAAEVLAQTAKGLGNLMNGAKIYFETAELIALVLVAMLTGLLFENIGDMISRRMRRKYA